MLGATPQFGFSPTGDPSQPPSFNPFPGDYSTGERNAARKAATSRVDALIASLPTTKRITGRYGAESAAAGGMAKSLSDHLAQSQLARVGFAAGAPNIFAQSVQSATAPAAGVIGPQTAGAGQGLIAAMAANTANSMAGAPGAATAQGNIVQGAIGRRQTDALNDRAQQATAIRLKLPELTDASLADSRDASYKAWAANENAWMARAQMAQQGNQFNAREANDAAAANAGLAQDTWQTGFTQDQQNARFGAAEAGRNARADAAAAARSADKNKDGKVSRAEQEKARLKIIQDQFKQTEKLRGQGTEAKPWVYRVTGNYQDDARTPNIDESQQTYTEFEERDTPLATLPDGWAIETQGSHGGPMASSALYERGVRELMAKGIGRKRAENVMQRYLGYNPAGPRG
jgi:hypothetical protein